MPKLVVVVEDDADIVDLIRAVLEVEGCTVIASVGLHALAEIHQRLPDLVLLDYLMPGMDGVHIEWEQRGDPSTSGIPIVAMTAAKNVAAVCQAMDGDGCLGKPFDVRDPVEVVKQPGHRAHRRGGSVLEHEGASCW